LSSPARPGIVPGMENTKKAATPVAVPDLEWRRVLHQLSNVLASVHSSLDLALAGQLSAETKAFLLQAQESARKGAMVIHELRGREFANPPPDAPGPADAREGHSDPVSGVESEEGTERVLVAEDDQSIRTLIRAVLTYRGYTVVEAVDGRDAVNQYREKGPFDLLILDLNMPRLDGRRALQQLRAQTPDVRALALTGSPVEESAVADPNARFDGHLTKPFHNSELVKLVRRVLDRKQ
jgi:CheY-like chemotaxis protein